MKPKVIALSGPPGSGKSTLIRAIKSVAPLYRSVLHDDFSNPNLKSFPELKAWFERGCNPNEFLLPELTAHIESMMANPSSEHMPILFETPYGRLHKQTGAFIDYLIWVDVPLDIALARQIIAFSKEQRRRNPNLNDTFNLWLENYLHAYIDMIAAMYRVQIEQVRNMADLHIDGLQAPADLANRVLAAIGQL